MEHHAGTAGVGEDGVDASVFESLDKEIATHGGGDSLDRAWEGFFEGDLDFTLLIKLNHSRSKRQILAKL